MKTGVKTMTVLVWNRVRHLDNQENTPSPLPRIPQEYSPALLNWRRGKQKELYLYHNIMF